MRVRCSKLFARCTTPWSHSVFSPHISNRWNDSQQSRNDALTHLYTQMSIILFPGGLIPCPSIRLVPSRQTGLRICAAEKNRDGDPFSAEQSVLCGPVCCWIIAKDGHLSCISRE